MVQIAGGVAPVSQTKPTAPTANGTRPAAGNEPMAPIDEATLLDLKPVLLENERRHQEVEQASLKARSLRPEAMKAWQEKSLQYLDWVSTLSSSAIPSVFTEAWLKSGAKSYLEARPLRTSGERTERFLQLFEENRLRPSARTQALMGAALQELPAFHAKLELTATSSEISALLTPATAILAKSTSPLARELAQKIASGEMALNMTKGQYLGTKYLAMVTSSAINLSNGQVGTSFFDMSPAFQASVLLHEFVHVKQNERLGGMLSGIKDNLLQKGLALLGYEKAGQASNASEQEAYRAQHAFLTEMKLGREEQVLTLADTCMLAGVTGWLASAS